VASPTAKQVKAFQHKINVLTHPLPKIAEDGNLGLKTAMAVYKVLLAAGGLPDYRGPQCLDPVTKNMVNCNTEGGFLLANVGKFWMATWANLVQGHDGHGDYSVYVRKNFNAFNTLVSDLVAKMFGPMPPVGAIWQWNFRSRWLNQAVPFIRTWSP